jgi:hypothetical protein
MNFYKEIYCGIYRACFQKVDTGAFSATALLSVFEGLNFFTTINLLQLVNLAPASFPSRPVAMAVATIILSINVYYFHFVKTNKNLLKNTKKKAGYIGDVYAVVYGVVSVVLFFKTTSMVKENTFKVVGQVFQN